MKYKAYLSRLYEKIIKYKIFIFIFFIAFILFSYWDSGRFRFKEEILLDDGKVIVVDRFFKAESFGELGGPGGWEAVFNSMKVVDPVLKNSPPMWQSDTGLIPILFDRDASNGEWFLIATFYSCNAWYKLGRPKLPYAEFRVKNEKWERVDLSRKFIHRAANVLASIRYGKEPALVTLDIKKKANSDLRIGKEYLKIVDEWTSGC